MQSGTKIAMDCTKTRDIFVSNACLVCFEQGVVGLDGRDVAPFFLNTYFHFL
jgi:hypothetical protein